jgi:transposase InsO family protein
MRQIEQGAADLEIRLIFSGVARPRGRGKLERFLDSPSHVLLSRLPGYARTQADRKSHQESHRSPCPIRCNPIHRMFIAVLTT